MRRDFPEMTRLQAGDLVTAGLRLTSDVVIHLACASGEVLDGNQYSGSVQLAARDALSHPEFTGVNWTLQARANGTWHLLNQSDLEYGLSGSAGDPRLRHMALDPNANDPHGDWLIYRYGHSGKIMLRPVEGAWLMPGGAPGHVLLGRCGLGDEARAAWTVIAK